MFVAHLTASRFFGGPERQMLELARALPPEIRSAFILFVETGLCRGFLEQVRGAGFEAITLQRDTPRLVAALRELVGVLRGAGVDVLCCHGYKANMLGLLAAQRLSIPVISVSRGWTGESLRVRLYEAIDRRVLRWMDQVVCVSEAQAQKVCRVGVRGDKITVIRNAIHPERFEKPDPSYRERLLRMFSNPPQKIVGAAGRLSPEKGFGVLVEAAVEVLKTELGVGFVVFGDGPLRTSLARQITALGMQGKFVLAGFRSDLDQFLPHLNLLAIPSFTEGLPNVALEALAASVPVVATAVGGTPEVIVNGHTGYLVPSGDSGAMAGRIVSLLSDHAVRNQLVEQGVDHVRQQFSFEAQTKAYHRLFEQLTGRRQFARPLNHRVAVTSREARG